jgi:hypothetical protein
MGSKLARLLVPGRDGDAGQQRGPMWIRCCPARRRDRRRPPPAAPAAGRDPLATPSITTTRASPLLRSIHATARPSRRQIGGASTNTLPSAAHALAVDVDRAADHLGDVTAVGRGDRPQRLRPRSVRRRDCFCTESSRWTDVSARPRAFALVGSSIAAATASQMDPLRVFIAP